MPNGEFFFDELTPGKHRLKLFDQGLNGIHEIGETEVILAGQDVTGVVITPFKPARVRVRVVMEGEEDKPLTLGSVFLIPVSADKKPRDNLMQFQPQDGTYVIDTVPPGRYRVWFNSAPRSYLKSVRSGGRVLDGKVLDVTDGASLSLLLIFSRNVASLSGEIESAQDQTARSLHVVAILEDPEAQSRIALAELDQSLHFSLDHLRPGKYIAFATEEDDLDLWDNADFLRLLQSDGTEVELHESEQATARLKVIPKSVTERIRQQLGI